MVGLDSQVGFIRVFEGDIIKEGDRGKGIRDNDEEEVGDIGRLYCCLIGKERSDGEGIP